MITVHEIKLRPGESFRQLASKLEKRLHIPEGSVKSLRIVKESVDAREKPDVCRVFSLDVECGLSDEKLAAACRRAKIRCTPRVEPEKTVFPSKKNPEKRPLVVGFGPCGIFAALALAKMGLRPIVIERGTQMEQRISDVENFWAGGKLIPDSNVQFGEGGAGTFSDGKLTTGTKSVYRQFILESFVEAGASPDILYKQKPHIGSDMLRTVVVNLRKKITQLGGEVRFETRLVSLDGCRAFVVCRGKEETIDAGSVILALGHSARDTVRALYDCGMKMEQKPFSMGVRIEHRQSLIDRAQYGELHEKLGLGPADYKLNVRCSNGRGVYTFCMCPGGYVVNSSSFEGMLVTNGMSNSARDTEFANSALLCDVRTEDYPSEHPLSGIEFQEKYESLAFVCAGKTYRLPTEPVKDFRSEHSLLKGCLPDFVWASLVEALPLLDRKLKGFNSDDALLYGIESRSSSPVRILRNENLQAPGFDRVYPAGEGAGYAGGIMSAAADGVRAAFKAAENYE